MTTVFLASFLADIKKLRDGKVRGAIKRAILNVEEADNLDQINALKRLSGHQQYFRIRILDYRIGIRIEDDTVTFVRCLHRREVYRYFP